MRLLCRRRRGRCADLLRDGCVRDGGEAARSSASHGGACLRHDAGARGHGGQRRRLAGRARAGDEAAGRRRSARKPDVVMACGPRRCWRRCRRLRNIRRAVPARWRSGWAAALRVSGLQRENHAAGRRLALKARLQVTARCSTRKEVCLRG